MGPVSQRYNVEACGFSAGGKLKCGRGENYRPMVREVGLVSCTKSERSEPASPRDLYEPSALFRKARAYCERAHDQYLARSSVA